MEAWREWETRLDNPWMFDGFSRRVYTGGWGLDLPSRNHRPTKKNKVKHRNSAYLMRRISVLMSFSLSWNIDADQKDCGVNLWVVIEPMPSGGSDTLWSATCVREAWRLNKEGWRTYELHVPSHHQSIHIISVISLLSPSCLTIGPVTFFSQDEVGSCKHYWSKRFIVLK